MKHKFYSQFGQDKYIAENVFPGKRNGYFVDIGAYDGVHCSNTYHFEQNGWRGMCFEPNPDIFKKLRENRKAACLEGAVSSKKTKKLPFTLVHGYAEMLSGLTDYYDRPHIHRIEAETLQHNDKVEYIFVRNYNFNSIIFEKYIDYLSIDTEGSELDILKSINWNNFTISCISVENNYGNNSIKEFLLSKGFRFEKRFECDELYTR